VYVDQIGDGSTISFTQTGAGNSIGSSATHATLTGDNNNVTMSQIGGSNVTALSITGSGNDVTSTITGSYNSLSLLCTSCSSVTMTDVINGSSNQLSYSLDTSAYTHIVNIETSSNQLTIMNDSTTSVGTTNNINISGGDSNIVDIHQSGAAGSNGHSIDLTVVGATNNVTLKQGGNVDSKVVATVTGSGNTMSINSNF